MSADALGVDPGSITGVGMSVGATALTVTSEVAAAPFPMTGDALKVTFDQKDLVLAEEVVQGGLLWDHIDSFFDVTFNEGGPFSGSVDGTSQAGSDSTSSRHFDSCLRR